MLVLTAAWSHTANVKLHNVTSVRVTAVPYNAVLETEIFCYRYLKINNSTIN